MPPRMHIVDDELILDDVCKNCEDGTSDLQVIQCNASNVHGYRFIDAYINVLRKSLAVCHFFCPFYEAIHIHCTVYAVA